ncbi:hypothetical protein [Dyella sp. A6]|uniref:hypothetical protein n=1 Tax=Dyella aluminiiresistens TaxID=3069105 RepID=UPI002E79FA52|nr:hypothetical protein [Dyella sp. A6]
MIQKLGASPFIDAAAVEAWDAWFRWREQGELRDLSVDATWERVAWALASVEPEQQRLAFARRLLVVFSDWQLLPGERILMTAGTPAAAWGGDDLVAVLNVASFVSDPGSVAAALDLPRFMTVAALAVHLLDNAATLQGAGGPPPERLHIGIIGLGDALALLGMRYDSDEARAFAVEVVRSLAQGCASGHAALAGQCHVADATERHGPRYRSLTAITSQRRLALFANATSDALEPAAGAPRTYVIEAEEGNRQVRSPGYAATLLGRDSAFDTAPEAARQAMRDAVQGWIDEAISAVSA